MFQYEILMTVRIKIALIRVQSSADEHGTFIDQAYLEISIVRFICQCYIFVLYGFNLKNYQYV